MQVGYVIRVHYMSRELYVNNATYVSSDFARCKIWENFMTELCFQLGFDFLIIEKSDDCEELSREVACSFNKLWSPPIKSRTNFRKPRKRRIAECFIVCYFPIILLMKVSCFLVGRQGVRHEASEDQQLPWREFGGMRN